jgi:hypothetical protein
LDEGYGSKNMGPRLSISKAYISSNGYASTASVGLTIDHSIKVKADADANSISNLPDSA